MSNLADALSYEVEQIINLLLGPGSNIYMPTSWGWGPLGWKAELVNDQTCLYTIDGYRKIFVRLDGIRAIDQGFTFGQPFEAGSIHEDRHFVDRYIYKTDAVDEFTPKYSYTFGGVKSELQAITDAFESEFSARVGEVYTGPAGAGFKQALKKSYEESVRKDTNFQETKENTFRVSKTPIGILVEAVRRTQTQRRHVSNDGYYDYSITLGHVAEAPLKREVTFANKAEFMDVIHGVAALDKAMYNGRSWVPFYQGGYARPDATFDNVSAAARVSPQHSEVLFQDFVVSEFDPFKADGDSGDG